MEKIKFLNKGGLEIVGILEGTNDQPVVILCHGLFSNKGSQTYKTLAKCFAEKNIATLRIDFHGHGESSGDPQDISVKNGASDILGAISFLKQNKFNQIGVMGSSFGGFSSIIAVSQSSDVSVLALRCPLVSIQDSMNMNRLVYEKWKKEGVQLHNWDDGSVLKLNYSYVESGLAHDGYLAAKKISIPTIIVHGDLDKAVSVEQSLKLAKIIPNSELHIIKGANHRFAGYKEESLDLIVDFIVKHF